MSIARDLNKERAKEFQTLCSAALYDPEYGTPLIVVGCGKPGDNSLLPYGLSYDVLMRLAHHRLIVNDMTSYVDLPLGPRQPTITVRQQEMIYTLRSSDDNNLADTLHRLEGILFTSAGQELFAVVEKALIPAYTEAMLKACIHATTPYLRPLLKPDNLASICNNVSEIELHRWARVPMSVILQI